MAKPQLKLDSPPLVSQDPGLASAKRPSLTLVVLAFAAVYVIWGSTYLAIKYAIGTLPPFLMAATRFLVAGTILFSWASLRGNRSPNRPNAQQWLRAAIIGALLLLGGNGGVTWAEGYVASGLAALLVAIEPVWVVILNWITGGSRPTWKVSLGLLTGLAGVALLVSGPFAGVQNSKLMSLIAVAVVLLSSLSWAGGSILYIRRPVQTSAPMGSGMQMLAGGALLLLAGLVTGEFARLDLKHASWLSIGALLYLIVFGSLVVFTAYSWLLRNVSPARAATYAYVNPVVAVLLGWIIAGERITPRMLVGAAVIVSSVVLITSCSREGAKSSSESPVSSPQEGQDDVDPCPTPPCA